MFQSVMVRNVSIKVLLRFVYFCITAIECSMVNALPNGTVMYSVDTVAPFEFGTVATLSCDNGFFLDGDDVRVCEDDDQLDTVGVWSESNATCEGKLAVRIYNTICYKLYAGIVCALLEDPGNGTIVYNRNVSELLDFGTEAYHSCEEGFFLVGESIRECGEGNGTSVEGEWSGGAPACSGM